MIGLVAAGLTALATRYTYRTVRLATLMRREERWGAYVQALHGVRETREQAAARWTPPKLTFSPGRIDVEEKPDPELQRAEAAADAARARLRALLPTVPGLSADRRAAILGRLDKTALAAAITEAEEELQRLARELDRLG